MTRRVARELRGLVLVTGGRGVVIFCRRTWPQRVASTPALEALECAAERLGFGEGWPGVVAAVAAQALRDVLSEAIEEQEARR